jgi:hypothetical protein
MMHNFPKQTETNLFRKFNCNATKKISAPEQNAPFENVKNIHDYLELTFAL